MAQPETESEPQMGKLLWLPTVPQGWARNLIKEPPTPLPAGFSRRFLLEEANAAAALGIVEHMASRLGWSRLIIRNVQNLEPERPNTRKHPYDRRFGERGAMLIDSVGFRAVHGVEVAVNGITAVDEVATFGFSEEQRRVLGQVAIRQLPVGTTYAPPPEELENLYGNMYVLPIAMPVIPSAAAAGV